MKDIQGIIQDILDSEELAKPDGRPLYGYRIVEDQLEELRRCLRDASRWPSRFSEDRRLCGAFCLWAAEHFCRTYEGGGWKWKFITEPHELEVSRPFLYGMVRRGLEFWGRKVLPHNNKNFFVTTLICEGGLPLRVLADQQGSFFQYFRRVLRDAERFEGSDVAELAEQHQEYLPKTVRKEPVFILATKLIQGIVELRKLTAEAEDPLLYLEHTHPNWQHQVPLRLEAVVAQELLRGLLREPPAREQRQKAPIGLEARLTLGANPRLDRVPIFAAKAEGRALADQLGVVEESLPSRFRLELMTAGGDRHPVALATRTGGGDGRFRLRKMGLSRLPRGPSLLEGFRLAVSLDGRTVELADFPGGDPLPESPWVFREQEGLLVMTGAGTVRSRAPKLVAALPPEATLQPLEAEVMDLGTLDIPGRPARRLIEVRGKVYLTHENESYELRSQADEDDTFQLLLSGKRASIGEGREVWCGPPSVLMVPESGPARKLTPKELSYRPVHGRNRQWQPIDSSCLGQVLLQAKVAGRTLLVTRALVAPVGFEVDVRPSLEPHEGRLIIRCPGVDNVDVSDEGDFIVETRRERDQITCHFVLDGKRPATVHVGLRLAGGFELPLELPFPVSEVRFLGPTGEPLPSELGIDRLDLCRARAVAARSGSSYWLEGRLFRGGWQQLALLAKVSADCFELPLNRVRSIVEVMLAATGANDVGVDLKIVELGARPHEAPRITIMRYDLRPNLRKTSTDCVVELNQEARDALGPDRLEKLKVRADPIWEPALPGDDDEELPGSATDGWWFSLNDREPGPWLITGWLGDRLVLRPTLETIGQPERVDSALLRAMTRFSKKERREAIGEALDRLAVDANHPDWNIVKSLLEALRHYPATTFEVVTELIERPDALALAMLLVNRQSFDPIWAKLERLPMMWHTVPLESWIKALKTIRETLAPPAAKATALPIQELMRHYCAPLLDVERPALACVAECACAEVDGLPAGLPSMVQLARCSGVLEGWLEPSRQKLLQLHADDQWPHKPSADALLAQLGLKRDELGPAWIEARHPERRTALNAPAVAAAASVFGRHFQDPRPVIELRLIRAFDTDWFDIAYTVAKARLITQREESCHE